MLAQRGPEKKRGDFFQWRRFMKMFHSKVREMKYSPKTRDQNFSLSKEPKQLAQKLGLSSMEKVKI